MIRAIAVALGVSVLTGCATSAIGTSATETYRLSGDQDTPWAISGEIITQTMLGTPTGMQPNTLVVSVNGEEAIRGNLDRNQEGTIRGSYQGHAMESVCNSKVISSSWIQVDCMILVDNERAVTLTL